MKIRAQTRSKQTRAGVCLAAGVLLLCVAGTQVNAADAEWVASWATSDMAAGTGNRKVATLENFTIRQVVRNSIGGDSLRLRISNVFGDKPLVVGGATVAVHDEATEIVLATLAEVRFSGSAAATIPAGEFLYSDLVSLQTDNFADIAVSLYFPKALPALTRHGTGPQQTYVSDTGNFIAAASLPVVQETASALFLTGLEVETAGETPLIVCFGDSITDGAGADLNTDWPTLLARRLAGEAGVIRQAISGNRLLHDFAGESGLSRFERDVLSWPNLDYVIAALGINDLGYPAFDDHIFPQGVHASDISVDELIAGYRELIAMAHARGVQVIGTTITPFKGSGHFSEAGESQRIAINQWIRESGEFDAVVDFDKVVRDETRPDQIGPRFHDGDDWLHPNAAGYAAMADSIDLTIFQRGPQ